MASDVFQYIDIPLEAIQVSEDAIIQWLGYNDDAVDPYVISLIRDYLLQTQPLIRPLGGMIIRPLVSLNDGMMQLSDTVFQVGKIISGQLKHSEMVSIFVATIGKEVEQFSDRLFQNGYMLEGYIVNLIGSEAAEAAAEYVQQTIAYQTAVDGYKITNRFSPGYCNWNVAEQFQLFSHFPDSFFEVTLTDSALMNPVKSVSGIIGIGASVKLQKYACSLCTDQKCIYRNRKRS